MKAFKKLAAIVLAGVMALAVLTGCSSNDKDHFPEEAERGSGLRLSITADHERCTCGNKAQWIAVNYGI